MYKIALCSDLHWCKNSSIVRKRGVKYTSRLENCIDTLNWFEDLAKEESCDAEYFLGDMFDRSSLDSEEITALNDVKWNDIKKYFLVGNHEASVSSLEFSTTAIFRSRAEIISDMTRYAINDYVDLFCIPYITTTEPLSLADFVSGDKKKVVFSHNDIAGIQYGKFVSKSGLDVSTIKNNCTLFFNGHLHNCGCIGNIYIVGNITGQNFNEDASKYPHEAYILTFNDDGSIEVDPRENPYAFNFYKIYINREDDLKILESLKRNSVVSVTCIDALMQATKDKISANRDIIEYRLSVHYSTAAEDEAFEFSTEDDIKKFVEFAATRLEDNDILREELAIIGGM